MKWNGSSELQVPHPLSLHLQDWRWALAQGQETLLPVSYLRPPSGGLPARSRMNLPRGWRSIRKGQTGPLFSSQLSPPECMFIKASGKSCIPSEKKLRTTKRTNWTQCSPKITSGQIYQRAWHLLADEQMSCSLNQGECLSVATMVLMGSASRFPQAWRKEASVHRWLC